jgi:predicted dehydrogenase
MRAALIGLGMVSSVYGEAFRNSEKVKLSKVFARRPEGRAAFLQKFGDLGATEAESVAEIAADAGIDFVILTTPPNARIDPIHTLVEAGKPVLMEKPIERTLKAATVVVEYCETKGVPLGIVLQHRARPAVHTLREKAAELGRLVAVEVNVPWWRPQSYYDEPGRGSYQRDGGGVLISQAIHTIDLMLSLTGPVAEVTAMCAKTGFHDMEAEDFVVAGMTFENGAVGQIFATTASFPGRGETITLHFRKGSARLEAGVVTLTRQDGTSEIIGQAAGSGAGANPMAFTSDWHQSVIEDFADALSQRRPPMAPGRAALAVHQLIDAIEKSGARGERVSLKEFPDGL